MLSGVQFALGQLSERVSLLEEDQTEGKGKYQRDDVEDALQAVDDFRIEVAVKLREKCEILSAAESLSARLEALLAKAARPPAPAMLELPDGHAKVLVEMPLTPDADSIRSLSKTDAEDPRSHLIIEVSESLDGDGCAAAEDVEKEYSISVPVTPMPAIPAADEKVNADRAREEVVIGVSPQQDEQLNNVPLLSELPDLTQAADVTEVTEVPPQIKPKDDFVSSDTTETTSAGEKESSLPSSCLPSDREVSITKKTVVGQKSFLTEAVSDERSSSIPSDFRVPMMMVVAKAEESSGGLDDLPIFKAVLEEGDVEFNVTTEKAEGLWKEPEEDLGLLDLDWEKDLIADDEDEQQNLVDETDHASDLDEAFQRLSPGISEDDTEEPQEVNEAGEAARETNLQRDSPPLLDLSSHAQGTA